MTTTARATKKPAIADGLVMRTGWGLGVENGFRPLAGVFKSGKFARGGGDVPQILGSAVHIECGPKASLFRDADRTATAADDDLLRADGAFAGHFSVSFVASVMRWTSWALMLRCSRAARAANRANTSSGRRTERTWVVELLEFTALFRTLGNAVENLPKMAFIFGGGGVGLFPQTNGLRDLITVETRRPASSPMCGKRAPQTVDLLPRKSFSDLFECSHQGLSYICATKTIPRRYRDSSSKVKTILEDAA